MALLGMVLVNFRIAMGVLAGGPTWLKPLLDALEGRSAASFVVLAGIGLGLSTRKLAWSAAMSHTARRALFLLIVGLLNYLVFPADIIHYYAVYFLLGPAVSGFPPLAAGPDPAAGDKLRRPAVPARLRSGLAMAQLQLSRVLDPGRLHPQSAVQRLASGGALAGLSALRPLAEPPISGQSAHPALAAGRRGECHGAGQGAVALVADPLAEPRAGATAGDPAHSPGAALPAVRHGRGQHPDRPLPLAGTRPARGSLVASVAAGRPADPDPLSGHIMLGMGVLEAIGWLQGQDLPEVVLAATLFALAALLFANLWNMHFERGPLEWLMRRLCG